MLLASNNPTKRQRLAGLLVNLDFDLICPSDVDLMGSIEENGSSHRENAEFKACSWSRMFDGLSIASDGGVIIPILGAGWDSLCTRRFAGCDANDAERAQRLLDIMRPYTGAARRISWLESVAVANKGELIWSWQENGAEGLLDTDIPANEEITSFWVGHLWCFPVLGKHYSELKLDELDVLGDHWSRLQPRIRSFFTNLGS